MMIRMRNVCSTRASNNGSNPGNSDHKHIQYCTEHENLNGAGPLGKAFEIHAKEAIRQAEKNPCDETRSQQIARHAPKPENGNQCEEAKNCDRSQVASEREAIEERNSIGHDHPSAKYS